MADSSWFQVAIVTGSGSRSVHAEVNVFPKTSRYESFLKEAVDDIPAPAAATAGNEPNFAVSLFLLFILPSSSVYLLS